MRGKFGIFLDKIVPIISSNNDTSPEELKQFLKRCYPELLAEAECAKSKEDVLKIVEKKCNIVNVAAIESIVDRYDIAEGKNLVTKYKEEISRFSSNIKLTFMQNKKLSSNSFLTCERIQFLLDWEPSDHCFDDIRLLLEKAFDDLAKEVIVEIIKKTNSILIICHAPLYLMDPLLLEAEANLPALQKEGLLRLTIGHKTVYDKTRDKKDKVRTACMQFFSILQLYCMCRN